MKKLKMDKEKQFAAVRKWKAENREYYLAQAKQYKAEHKEEISDYNRRYYLANKERLRAKREAEKAAKSLTNSEKAVN